MKETCKWMDGRMNDGWVLQYHREAPGALVRYKTCVGNQRPRWPRPQQQPHPGLPAHSLIYFFGFKGAPGLRTA